MPFPWNDQSIPAKFVSPSQIVVASDLTDTERLLPHIWAQAKACTAGVSLVHALRDPLIERPEQSLEEEMYASRLLGPIRHALETEGVQCSLAVKKGAAADVVAQEVARVKAGRLMIGTHRHGPCGQNMIGTIANALLLTAKVPVFVIPPEMKVPSRHTCPRRILHPVVPSGSYRENMCFAAAIAHACGSELTFLHVIPPASAIGPYAEELETKTRHEIEDDTWPPDLHFRTVLEYGDPVQVILNLSASEDIDWIVMGITHDFPWWSMQNSHTYRVIAESLCPVLTFHDRVLPSDPEKKLFAEELHAA